MSDYAGPAIIKLNDRPSLDTESCQIKRSSNAKRVKTLALGTAGKTKGAPDVMITLKAARRIEGDEFDWKGQVFFQDDLNISVIQAGEEEFFRVWVEECDSNSEVDTPATLDITLAGKRIAAHPF